MKLLVFIANTAVATLINFGRVRDGFNQLKIRIAVMTSVRKKEGQIWNC